MVKLKLKKAISVLLMVLFISTISVATVSAQPGIVGHNNGYGYNVGYGHNVGCGGLGCLSCLS
jgi:hypothetical protein